VSANVDSSPQGTGTVAQQLLRRRYVGIQGSNKVIGALEVQQVGVSWGMNGMLYHSTASNGASSVACTATMMHQFTLRGCSTAYWGLT